MKILIVAGLADFIPEENFDQYIGIDRGSLYLLEKKKPLDLAVGDFDSVSELELKKITDKAVSMIKLLAEKDETDLEVALDWVLENFPAAELTIVGALGGRLDHLLTNIFLVTRGKYQTLAAQTRLLDQQNIVRYLTPGSHLLHRLPGYKYIGFVQLESQDTLAIEGAKYPLKAEENFSSIYASNEFISDKMTVSLKIGMVMVIYSGDRKREKI